MTMKTGNTKAYKLGVKDMDEMESVSYYRWPFYSSTKNLKKNKIYGPTRVFVLLIGFFVLPATLIILPLYLKYKVFADLHFAVTDFDVIKMSTDSISSIFCEGHLLHMEDSTFNVFKIKNIKTKTTEKEDLKLNTNFSLDGNNLRYWGFFLNEGITVNLTLCSRYDEARIMIVKDTDNFRTCGLMNDADQIKTFKSNDLYNDEIQLDSLNFSLKAHHILQRSYEHNESLRLVRSVNSRQSINNYITDYAVRKQLQRCYEGKILIDRPLLGSNNCDTIKDNITDSTLVKHQAQTDGHYFYIVYSDNTKNKIWVTLDIFRPTYEYSKYACLNESQCNLPLSFASREEVIVEILIQPKINRSATSVLVSSCQPRTYVYIAFITMVFVAILLFAFV